MAPISGSISTSWGYTPCQIVDTYRVRRIHERPEQSATHIRDRVPALRLSLIRTAGVVIAICGTVTHHSGTGFWKIIGGFYTHGHARNNRFSESEWFFLWQTRALVNRLPNSLTPGRTRPGRDYAWTALLVTKAYYPLFLCSRLLSTSATE